jgi:hypothetical protein
MRGSGGYNNVNSCAVMRGGGIGNIFSKLFRSVIPLVQRVAGSKIVRDVASDAKSSALKAGLNVVSSALDGENIKTSAKRNLKGLREDVISSVKNRAKGGGVKKRKKKKTAPKKSTMKGKKKKTTQKKKPAKGGKKKTAVKKTVKKKSGPAKKKKKRVTNKRKKITSGRSIMSTLY